MKCWKFSSFKAKIHNEAMLYNVDISSKRFQIQPFRLYPCSLSGTIFPFHSLIRKEANDKGHKHEKKALVEISSFLKAKEPQMLFPVRFTFSFSMRLPLCLIWRFWITDRFIYSAAGEGPLHSFARGDKARPNCHSSSMLNTFL